MDKLNLKVPPVIVFFTCLGLSWVINRILPDLFNIKIAYWITAIPVIAGAVIAFVGVVQFSMQSTTVNPHKPDRATSLVKGGIYRFTRNPMYLGLLLLLFAGVLKFGNLLGFIVLPLFVLYMNRFQIIPEENAVEEIFGDAYRDYKDHVRRWI